MPSQTIFTDDLVTKDGEIGIVDRAPNSSDEESDGDDIIDDADTSGRLPAGAAHVVWKNESKLRTELAANLSLADRLFLLGDIVARSNDQLGQTGIVVAMQMFFDLSCADGTVLKQVPGKVLQPLAACRPGALVVHQQAHWLGRVDEVYDNVYLAFDDGSECKVLRTDAESLRVATPTMDEQTWFWPSMRVTASRDTLKDTNTTKWIKGSYKSSYAGQPATVVKVQAAQALVRWLTSTPSLGGSEPSFTSPRESQRPSRLLELHAHHSRSCWRLGEHAAVLREDLERLRAAAEGGNGGAEGVVEGSAEGVVEGSAEGDGAPSAGCAGADTDGGAKKPPHAPRKNKNGENSAVDTCVEIVSCHTRVDVIWQDGTRLSDVAATTLAPAKHVDGYYEFWPQDFVVGKTTGDGSPPPDGVVESVNHEQRICVVTWRESRKREVIPVYEIAPHPDFNFKVGDVVLRLPGDGAGEHAHADGSAATALARLAFIGQVVSVGPQLQIRWMDGSESEAPPEELYVVNTEEEEEIPPEDEEAEGHDIEIRDLDSGAHFGAGRQAQRAGEADAADDEAGESSGWETVSGSEDGEVDLDDEIDEGNDDIDDDDSEGSIDGDDQQPLLHVLPNGGGLTIMGLQAPPAGRPATPPPAAPAPAPSRGPSRGPSRSDDEAYESAEDMDAEPDVGHLPPKSDGKSAAATTTTTTTSTSSSTTTTTTTSSSSDASCSQADLSTFDQFQVVDEADLSFHYYASLGSPGQGSSAAAAPAAAAPAAATLGLTSARTAQRQWQLLQDGLPPGIFVVAYAERVDLLRVLIVGPPGTPYHDAVFVFDLQLPADFPQQPPAVHYLSHGERINPNLYENGKVCLSLLGTWTGRESCELWNPKTSTVLQVLVSIQALVLCEQPYYNEAGYERQLGTDEGGHHARRYNEGAFLLSLKSMQTSLRYLSPPFEALTRTHFQKARARIVDRCRKLLELKAAHPEAMAMLNGTCSSTAGQAPSHATAPAGAAGGEGGGISAEAGSAEASANDQVSRAGFKGVLNTWPTLGFLHSLERSLPALEMSLDGVVDTPAEGGS